MQNKMQSKYKWLLLALLFLVLVAIFPYNGSLFRFNYDWNSSTEDAIIRQNERTIDSLRTIIEENNATQLKYDDQLSELSDSIAELKYIIRKRENTISNIKKETNEILNHVSKFNSSDILQWGTERYKDSLDIK